MRGVPLTDGGCAAGSIGTASPGIHPGGMGMGSPGFQPSGITGMGGIAMRSSAAVASVAASVLAAAMAFALAVAASCALQHCPPLEFVKQNCCTFLEGIGPGVPELGGLVPVAAFLLCWCVYMGCSCMVVRSLE